jgi:para-aminobenzoate synthetase component I
VSQADPPTTPAPLVARLHRVGRAPRRADGTIDVDACADALGPADLLESAAGDGWSYVVPHGPQVVVDDGRSTRLSGPQGSVDLGTDPFDAVDRLCVQARLRPSDEPAWSGPELTAAERPPFLGGLIGAFAYDLGRRIERIAPATVVDRPQPELFLRIADLVLAVAPGGQRAWFVTRPVPTPLVPVPDRSGLAARLADAQTHIEATPTTAVGSPDRRATPTPQTVSTSLPRERYLTAVGRILDQIAAGEVFQVNLTQRLTARWPGDTLSLYRALRQVSQAAYGAALPAIGVASVSPESFLEVHGSRVVTRPIKGTRPRAADATLDAALADDLATSTKDRAENVMVVDMERNDLGRVCRPGTVRVPHLTEVEGHPTVWHLVSTVTGELRDGIGYGELLRATFPCGSITGAPKVSAMQRIEDLEGVRRGWYCGAIGFLGPGRAALSVAIRTATLGPDGRVDYGAGGGIVADSDPEAELAESLDKAVAFLTAVAATHVDGPDPADGTAAAGGSTAGTWGR